MKKTIASILILMLFLAACSSTEIPAETIAETFELKEVIGNAGLQSRLGFSSLQQLLEPAHWGANVLEDRSADIAVIGEFIEDASTGFRYDYNAHFGKDVVVNAFARGQFRVTEVLNGDVKRGDVITIVQRYAFDEERGELVSFCELTPMHKGDRWIYFLNRNGDTYSLVSGADSRYPIPNEELVQITDEVSSLLSARDEWIRSKEQVESRNFDEEEWLYMRDRAGNLYRFAEEELEKWFELAGIIGVDTYEILSSIDSSVLGVINRYDFNFYIYTEIIEHFGLEAEDWKNPGRDFDARVIEMYEIERGWIS
jgi:hypothetical protein